jgi:hypothetical protein
MARSSAARAGTRWKRTTTRRSDPRGGGRSGAAVGRRSTSPRSSRSHRFALSTPCAKLVGSERTWRASTARLSGATSRPERRHGTGIAARSHGSSEAPVPTRCTPITSSRSGRVARRCRIWTGSSPPALRITRRCTRCGGSFAPGRSRRSGRAVISIGTTTRGVSAGSGACGRRERSQRDLILSGWYK